MVDKLLSAVHAYTLDSNSYNEFDLSALIRKRAGELAPSAFDKNQEITMVGTTEKVPYNGHEILLGEAISNLIHNAIQYNESSSITTISLLLRVTAKEIEIAVSDEGQVFSNDEFHELTQPFRTSGSDQSGSGFGLSIAKDIARMHRGTLQTTKTDSSKTIMMLLP